MTFSNTERVPIRSHWPSGTPYPPGDDKQILATINSPPDITVLFPSVHQTDAPLSLFYSMTFSNTERVPIRSHWPSGTPYPPGDDKQILATINSPPDINVLFPSDTKLTIHFIVLFYDLFQHRACSYTQSLAFGYSVSAWR